MLCRIGRQYALRSVMRRRGILLTTYGMVQRNSHHLDHRPSEFCTVGDEDDPIWDWVLLDEVPTSPQCSRRDSLICQSTGLP